MDKPIQVRVSPQRLLQPRTAEKVLNEIDRVNGVIRIVRTEQFISMTRCAKRKTTDRLHCTYSAIIDIFEMENNREPSSEEVNNILMMIGDRAAITK